jgi:flavin reductase (DIM6/NTAB) family NADH-FMN oxidoreductase RutF
LSVKLVPPTLPLRAAHGQSAPVIAPARTFADAARFRDAMARLASGVAIVACLDQGAPRGLLVSSLTSLSLEPPRMLFCVRKSAGSHDALIRADRCSVSVLADRHAEEAERFSSPARTAERFSPEAWRLEKDQPPRFTDALLSVTGSLSGRTDAGSHSVFFMDIETVEATNAGPLIYFDRAFRSLRAAAGGAFGS